MSEYAALVAIDWADQQHAVCLLDPSIGEREQTIVKHTPAALQEWAAAFVRVKLHDASILAMMIPTYFQPTRTNGHRTSQSP